MTVIQYLLDGTDLSNYARTITTIDSDLPTVGDDIAVPYRPGETFRRRTAGPGQVQLGLTVTGDDGSGGDTVERWQANWYGLKALAWKLNATRTLTRRLTLPSGVVESSAQVTLNQLPQATMQGDRACTTVLDFKLLDGYFYGTSDVAFTSPGTVTVLGDARTTRVTLSVGAGVTVANSTTGASLTYSGTGTASIDVQGWTANNGADVSGQVSWPPSGHDFWFDLDPGSNTLTGTASGTYRPAYLP